VIVDAGITTDLTVGQDRRIPQDGDTQTLVPPVVAPVVLALKPMSPNPVLGTGNIESAYRSTSVSVAPSSAANDVDIMTLAPGLYELELNMASWFDFVKTAAADSFVGIYLIYLNVNMVLLYRYAAIGSFNDYNRLRLLLKSQATIGRRNGATGVGQNLTFTTLINAIRIL
jgi:hypothetical protein